MRTIVSVCASLVWLVACGKSNTVAPDAGFDASDDADVDAATEDANVAPPEGGSVEVTTENGLRVVTFTTASFVVAPNQERFVCQNFANPLGEDVAIVRSHSSMTGGSHHMFAFQQPTGNTPVGDLADCSGLEFGPSAHGASSPERTIEYPEGVARAWSADDGIRIQAHYFNVTTQPIVAHVTVVLHTTSTDGQQLAASIFFNNLSIGVAPNSTGSAERTCTLPQDIELMNTNSHMHQFGTRFTAVLGDGTMLYETNDWSEPEPQVFDPPLHLPAGTQITYRCEYTNTSNSPLTFGESAMTNEMCILTGQFYPAPNGGITCM